MELDSTPTHAQLNASAAFQLLVAAGNPGVREAAAEALWPRELIQADDLDCSDAAFESLPYHERALALLVAAVIEANPCNAMRLGVRPQYEFLAPRIESNDAGRPRVFRMRGGSFGPIVRRPTGPARRWERQAVFSIPRGAAATMMQICSWGTCERAPYRDQYSWRVDEKAASINLSNRLSTRTRFADLSPVLVSATGVELPASHYRAKELIESTQLDVDSSLILRLCAGGLAGAVISFSNVLPIVRGRRPRDATLSLELGPSLEAPVIASFFKGSFEPRYELGNVVPRERVLVRILGGQTFDELHDIARMAGVWHGPRVRGSFAYHPLRSSNLVPDATPTALEVA